MIWLSFSQPASFASRMIARVPACSLSTSEEAEQVETHRPPLVSCFAVLVSSVGVDWLVFIVRDLSWWRVLIFR